MRRVRLVEVGRSPQEAVVVDLDAADRLVESGGSVSAFSDGKNAEFLCAAESGKIAWVWHRGRSFEFRLEEPPRRKRQGTADDAEFRAPMPGRIARLCVPENEHVSRGVTLLILEAMKMEHEIKAPAGGRVARFRQHAGAQVEAGAVLLDFEAEGNHA